MRKSLFLCFAVIATMLFASGIANAQTPTYDLPKKDAYVGVQTVSEPLLFYDNGGSSGNINSIYYTTAVTFKPENEGDQLQITFNSIDLINESESKFAKVYVYDGVVETYNSVTTGYLAELTGQQNSVSFTSTTGAISVLYYSKGYSLTGAGWEAVVEPIASKDMEWVSLTATQDFTALAYPAKNDMPLIKVNMLTDGGGNPFGVTSLKFDLTGTENLSDIANVRCLYSKGADSPVGAKQFGNALESASGELVFTDNVDLRAKNNYFWLVADVKPTAKAGDKLDARLISATVTGDEKVSSAIAPEGYFAIQNMVMMPVGPVTFKVGDLPISFYDDGGPEGNITEQFTGQVTFVPEHAGKKVRIVFTKLDLFNTSSIGKNDILKIYNGQTIDEANLNETILKDLLAVSSTAADGSLTVSLVSTTGIPKSGWEARVEEFTPQAMEVDRIAVSHPVDATVCAGESNADILLIDLHTVNTEPVAAVSQFVFSTAGTDAPISGATLWSLGKDKEGSRSKIGEATLSGNTLTFDCASTINLIERDNYFMLTYNIATNAANGQAIDASLASVTVNSSAITPWQGSAEGDRKVRNIWLSKQGSNEVTVLGEWEFANSPASNSYLSYDGAAGDQTVTFVPATAGKIIELDFSKFSINWPTYGYAPSFVVYSGRVATGTPLWSCTKDVAKVGPEKVLRSQAADGSVTVVFNPNGNNGASTDGFLATVSEYQSHPMTIESVKAIQASTDILKGGDTDQLILGVEIKAEGDRNPLSFTEMKVKLKGSQSQISKVKLYTSGDKPEFVVSSPIAEADVTSQQAEVVLTLTSPIVLPEKSSWFWIAYDMNPTVQPDVAIDASLASVTVGGQNVVINEADPEGVRETKTIYYFQNGDNVVDVDGSLMFYDDGGPDGKYTNTNKGTVTFRPAEGKVIKFIFHSFYTNINDDFDVYDGTGTEGTRLARLYSSKTDVAPIVSGTDDGALTVQFNPTRNLTNDGWAIEVVAFTPQPLSVTNVFVKNVAPAKVMRGSEKNTMLRMEVEVTGDKGHLALKEFDFSKPATQISAIGSAKLWSTGTIDSFKGEKLYGEASSTPYKFMSDSEEITKPGKYYYWLTYDVDSDAALQTTLTAALSALKWDDSTTDSFAESEEASVSVESGLHGTKVIGKSKDADFSTFAEAVEVLKEGVDGPVVFEIEDGEYVELVTIPEIPGTTSVNTVTFRSQSGNRDNVQIHYDSYSEPPYSDDKQAKQYGVITFDGADFTTFENITVYTPSMAFNSVVRLRNASRDCALRNCHIFTEETSESSSPELIEMYSPSGKADVNNDRFTLENCLLEGGRIGIKVGGTVTLSPERLPFEKGARIIGNEFRANGRQAIYVNGETESVIKGNTITNTVNCYSSFRAIDIAHGDGDFTVEDNVIGLSGPADAGINIRPMEGTQESYGRVINNEINIATAKTVSGIVLNNTSPYLQIAHNTVRITGDAGTSRAFYIYDKMEGGAARNNIFQNEAGGYAVYVHRDTYLPVSLASNAMYSSTDGKLNYIGADVNTLEEWVEQTSDRNSFVEKVNFLSENILEPADAGSLLAGVPLDFVTTDLNGTARDAAIPTIGAYEYSESTGNPTMAEGYPQIAKIGYDSASAKVQSDLTGKCAYIIKASDESAPVVDDFDENVPTMEVRKGRQTEIAFSGLEPKTEYKFYCRLISLRGNSSEIYVSEPFTTTYRPTAVSTFEDVKELAEDGFEDGTARFTGFAVEEVDDAVVEAPNARVAKLAGDGEIVLTNAEDLTLTGFFYKSDAEAAMSVFDASGLQTATFTIPASGVWKFYNLRDKGAVTSLKFTSDGDFRIDNFSGVPLALTVELVDAPETANEGSEVRFSATAHGGVEPYSFRWTDASGEEIGTGSELSHEADRSKAYFVEVTDAWESSAKSGSVIRVKGSQHIATFDDLYLDEESHWSGDTSVELGNDEFEVRSTFFSGSFEFNNLYTPEWDSWSFFGYSNSTSTEYTGNMLQQQYNSAVGSGHDSSNFGVLFASTYMGKSIMTLTNTDEGEKVPGLWFTNSAWVVSSILNGDGMSGPFEKDDYMKLIVTGAAADGRLTRTECYLADYRPENENDRYYIDTWQWMPLDVLGDVVELSFEIESTKRNSYGITTPTYVCLDDIGANREVADAEQVEVDEEEPTFNIAPFFTFDSDDATVVYSIETDPSKIELGEDADVRVLASAGEEFDFIAHAVQRGRHEYVRIPVKVNEHASVATISADKVRVYPVPARESFTVATDMDSYSLQLIGMSGLTIYSASDCSGFTKVEVGDIPEGAYIVRLCSADGAVVNRRVIVTR